MKYLSIEWKSHREHQPFKMLYEVDDDGYETRKVELYKSRIAGVAGPGLMRGGSWISPKKFPSIAEINMEENFQALEIDAEDFEYEWIRALQENGVT